METATADDTAGWVTAGPFRAATQQVVVETNRPEFAAQVEADLRDLRVQEPGVDAVVIRAERQPQSWLPAPWTVEEVGGPPAPSVGDDTVRIQLIAEFDRVALTRGRGSCLPLRAAAVVRAGRAVLLAGDHRTGKTTLASRLVRSGWQYLADAVTLLVLEDPFEVLPYWRPFTLEPGEAEPAAAVRAIVPAGNLGELAGPTPLGAIVVARGADDPGPAVRVGPAVAIGLLTAHLPLMPDGRSAFRRLADMTSTVPAWTVSFTDADAVAAVNELTAGVP